MCLAMDGMEICTTSSKLFQHGIATRLALYLDSRHIEIYGAHTRK